MEKLNGKSLDITKENIQKLKELFPEAVTEGKIKFDVLQELLGEEIERSNERYEFRWHGKGQAIKISQTPSLGTLRPDKESSKNWDTTENLYIEGDNLEVLKLLQKSYFGKVKMIYIDPPYNTGKDFVYKDNFYDSISNYKDQTNQKSRTNPETSGRFHTDWLNMTYPRLRLARNLLKDDGVIFISIDDNEVTNLKKVCNEVFGEENFVAQVIWEKKYGTQNDAKYFSIQHDYILAYAKTKSNFIVNPLPRTEEQNNRYKNPDNDPRGVWKSADFSVGRITEKDRYETITPSGRRVKPPEGRSWVTSEENFKRLVDENRIWFGKTGNNVPSQKKFLTEVKDGVVPKTTWHYDEVGHTDKSNKDLRDLLEGAFFDYPKPVDLLKRIVHLTSESNDIILDFFSGSATTAHATMRLNAEDGGNRKFIMVQLPELTDEKSEAYKAGYKNICEIGKERIRRAGDKIVKETGKTDLDIGFKVFKLDSSNIKAWDPMTSDLPTTLEDFATNIKPDRTQEDLLYELMIKMGHELTDLIEKVDVNGKTIFNINAGTLLICLEDHITEDIIAKIPKLKSEFFDSKQLKVVFKESGFKEDDDKMNAMADLKQLGITDVKSV